MRQLKLYISILALFLSYQSNSQFEILSKNDSLLQNAKELIVYDTTSFYVRSTSKSVLLRKYKTVVLKDPFGEGKEVYLYQDNFKNIESAFVEVTSMNGQRLERAKLKDFSDISSKGNSMASDSRLLYYRVLSKEVPYIVEVEYEVSYSGSLFYPRWKPQSEGVAIISAYFTIESQLPNSFRYQSYNVAPNIENEGRKVSWSVDNLMPYRYEYYSFDDRYYGPVVYTAPNEFQMDFIEGSMNTWSEFGEWINSLNEGKDDLDSLAVAEIKEMISDDSKPMEKIRIIYDYLQEKTRYVSIQLGIGGWQPFSSSYVHENGYGDCKALSYYTKSLLEKVGVDAYYTLINAGEYANPVNDSFPMSGFNHAILTVPLEGDTVWLECTSQTNPFGYLGTFTSDRNALMIKDHDSKLIHTKKYSTNESIRSSNYEIELNQDGTASVFIDRTYKGLMIEQDDFDRITRSNKSDQVDWFYDKNDWTSMTVNKLEIKAVSDSIVPVGGLEASLFLSSASKKAGKRLFLALDTYLSSNDLVVDKSSKKFPFEIRFNKSYIDSLTFKLPEGYRVENEFKSVNYVSDFGSLNFDMKIEGDKCHLVRSLTISAGKHEPGNYVEFQDFIAKIKRTESKKLVLVRKT